MDVYLISGFLSIMNTVFFCMSNFKKTKKGIVFLHMCCNLCDFFMYLVLGARTGVVNATVDICKNFAYSKMDSMLLTVLFSAIRIMLLVTVGYDGAVTVLFVILEIVALLILKCGTSQHFRILTAARQGVWVVYDFMFATTFIACLTFTGFVGSVGAVLRNRFPEPDGK